MAERERLVRSFGSSVLDHVLIIVVPLSKGDLPAFAFQASAGGQGVAGKPHLASPW
mgnify:CR=1 FL=1